MTKSELKNLFSRESFLEDLKRVDSMETLQLFLARHDLKMSLKEIGSVGRTEGELTEKELCAVGGGMSPWAMLAWKCFTAAAGK